MRGWPAQTQLGIAAVAWLICCVEPSRRAEAAEVTLAVVGSGGVGAYREACQGFRAALGERAANVEWFELEGENTARVLEGIRKLRPQVVVAMGSRAVEAVAALDYPVVATMVLDDDGDAGPASNGGGRVVTRISLEAPVEMVLERTRRLLPDRRRLAVVLSPARASLDRQGIQGHARTLGYSITFIECRGPKEMLEAIPRLRDRVDLVWCLPDRALFPPSSVPALILAAIRNRLPLIGFSEGFVRAGAPIGYYASYREIGVQTAEAIRRLSEGRPMRPREAPRTVRTALNERVLRVLGIEVKVPSGAEEVEFAK